jgi:hypothetical protein
MDYILYITRDEHLNKIISEMCTLLSNPICKKVTKGLFMAFKDSIMSDPKGNLATSLQIERAFDHGTITMSMLDVRTCKKYLSDLVLYDITSSEDLVRLCEHRDPTTYSGCVHCVTANLCLPGIIKLVKFPLLIST